MKNLVVHPKDFLTGQVVALCGKINSNGIFEATDFTFAGLPPLCSSLKLIEEEMEVGLTEKERKLAVIISGLEFCNDSSKTETELLIKFLIGQCGSEIE